MLIENHETNPPVVDRLTYERESETKVRLLQVGCTHKPANKGKVVVNLHNTTRAWSNSLERCRSPVRDIHERQPREQPLSCCSGSGHDKDEVDCLRPLR
jgi:hypothetical protein